jgi:molecular chaperone DnaK
VRTTIDFGIDLGTTNSAIAMLDGISTVIVKNNADADITPSVVSIDKKGAVYVGQRAKNRLLQGASEDVYGEFKRRMGTDFSYSFKSSGVQRRPEDLSAEILKSLRSDVQQRTGEVIESAVITVPAAFELHQCDYTRKAALQAGLTQSPLLQEPVAAALAYGFQVEQTKAYWLVYDFGGGTFDAAVIKSDEGTINVVNHGGDNFLGGADIDWAIVNKVLIPRLLREHDFKDFRNDNPKWRQAFSRLKWYAEAVKIELSRAERATADAIRFESSDGTEVEFECEVARSEVISAAEPYIQRSIDICRQVLSQRNLKKGDVERVILVGGPTLAPYFRERLSQGLGIALDHRVDPLTAVARGAAIFAGTQRVSEAKQPTVIPGEYYVEFKHKPVGLDSAPMVGGRVIGEKDQNFTGYVVEMINVKTKWSSGKIGIRTDGAFITTLHAERGERNTYLFTLFDASGRKQKSTPDTLTYTIGAGIDEQTLPNSIGIALGDNAYEKLFERGRGLPLKAMTTCQTIRAIRRGGSDVVKIPVVEGEQSRADRNRRVGVLEIRGDNIQRDLPVGSEIEVTLLMDQSRMISVLAYVPVLDAEFSIKLDTGTHCRAMEELRAEFDTEIARFKEVKANARGAGGDAAARLLESVENAPVMQEVRELLGQRGDPDAVAKCEKRLLELKVRLDKVADELQWPALVAEAREAVVSVTALVAEQGAAEHRKRCADLCADIQKLCQTAGFDDLKIKLDSLNSLRWEMLSAQPAFWVYQHQELEKQLREMSDPVRATRLLEQGRAFVSQNNITGLQNVVRELWNLLPDDAQQELTRGYEAGVVKSR